MDLSYQTAEELQLFFGKRLKQLRIDSRMTQAEAASKAGVSLRALQKLEAGEGSTLETVLRFLKAIDRINLLETIAPHVTVSPMAMLASGREPQRVRHSRKADSKT